MKKLFIFALMIGSIAIVAPSVEAKSSAATVAATSEASQMYRQRRRARRTVTTTRVRRVGRYRYRETIRVTYLPNGRTRTQVIRRVRLVGRRNW
jgi:uncharacterized membrane protein